jgi:hypothetical protein
VWRIRGEKECLVVENPVVIVTTVTGMQQQHLPFLVCGHFIRTTNGDQTQAGLAGRKGKLVISQQFPAIKKARENGGGC